MREHEVVVLGRHGLDIGAERRQNAASFSIAVRVGACRRRQDAPAIDEQFGKAGVGAGIFGAGDRMRRHEMHVLRQMRRHVAHDRALTEPTSETIAPGVRCGPISLATAPAGADRNADDDEVGAFDRFGVASRPPDRRCRARRRARRVCRASARWRRSSATAPCARAARAIERADQADADQREAVE